MSRRLLAARSAVVLTLAAAAGCGSEPPTQKTYPVTGKVLLDGAPVKGARVALVPKDATKFVMNERPQAVTGADGTFALTTYVTGDGAPAGEYFVGLQSDDEGDEGADQSRRAKGPRVPARYVKPQDSGLVVTVRPEPTALEPFQLTGGKK